MTRYKDDFRDHCGECVHYVPWPEVAMAYEECRGEGAGIAAPDGCCLVECYGAKAVSASDSPNCTCSCHTPCRFERGSRSRWLKEIKKEQQCK